MDSQGCELCCHFNTRPGDSFNPPAGEWKMRINPGDLSDEYRLFFTSRQLQRAANSGCANCSLLIDGLHTISKNLDVFDSAQPYQGRIISRTGCALQVEVRGSTMDEPIGIEFYKLSNTEDPIPSSDFGPRLIIGTAEEVLSDSPLERSMLIIRKWISYCDNKHGACAGSRKSSRLPTRVLDVVGKALDRGSVFLVESNEMKLESEKNLPYITLSHCWGKTRPLTTTQAKFDAHKKEIPLENLPKTFQDAIIVVRALGIRYIWIDSLCIIQGDDADWDKEAILMASVYSNSYLNIAATGSCDSRGGCFYPRKMYYGFTTLPLKSYMIDQNTNHAGAGVVFVRPSFEKVHQRYHLPNEQSKIGDSIRTPLLSRAWVFQERQLASRTLHFHPAEMIMECKSALRCECTGLDKIRANANKEFSDLYGYEDWEVTDQWFRVVNEYTALTLSYSKDRLVALSGIAMIFQDRLKTAYLAWIWEADISRSLLWGIREKKANRERIYETSVRNPRADSHCAPTWSWASPVLVDGDTINFPAMDEGTFTPHQCFSLVSTNVPWLATDSSKNMASAFLELRGLLVLAKISYLYTDPEGGTKAPRLSFARDPGIYYSGNFLSLDTLPSTVERHVTESFSIYCLLVGTMLEDLDSHTSTWFSTLLIERSSLDMNLFRRVGIFDVREDTKAFLEAKQATIKLT
ncbi:hypothetical protein BOTCAL_0238g00020 [Botryotinia calthae]|uniref:Heterokaryon incompatibility domain-containing protein n=1 Tax=Botryotinia calthae TaxID=38488 RepID=A0A4Y8CX93_9HELO|nr:hypothetical protein BOTCAL_0238g00020 [Botryotinia calthae]